MQKAMRLAALLGLVLVMAFAVSCVGNKKFDEHVDNAGARMNELQSGIETNEERIGDLRGEVDSKIAAVDQKASSAVTKSGEAKTVADEALRRSGGKVTWEVKLDTDKIKFDLDKAILTAAGKAELDKLIGYVKGLDHAAYVEIAGHTDSTGSEKYNMALGMSRAESVRSYMSDQGVALHMMSVITYGEGKPIADNSTREGRAQNRRVVVRVRE